PFVHVDALRPPTGGEEQLVVGQAAERRLHGFCLEVDLGRLGAEADPGSGRLGGVEVVVALIESLIGPQSLAQRRPRIGLIDVGADDRDRSLCVDLPDSLSGGIRSHAAADAHISGLSQVGCSSSCLLCCVCGWCPGRAEACIVGAEAASAEHRKAMTLATPSGRLRRPSSMSGRSSLRNEAIASSKLVPFCWARWVIISSVISVAMNAGETVLTSRPSEA